MSIRTAALAGTALVLALVLTASPAAKRPPTPGGQGGAHDADEPPHHRELGHERLAGVERIDGQLDELVVLRPSERRELHPSRPAADDVHALEPDAR